MEEAAELANYLPLSFKSEKEEARLSCTCCQRRSDNFTKTVFDLFIGSSGQNRVSPEYLHQLPSPNF